MTKEARYFTRLDSSISVPIRVGNGEVVMTAGKGDITVMTNKGKRTIKDVFLVPGLEKNVMKKGEDILIVSLYVDDIIITGNNSHLIDKFKTDMKKEFEMTDLGLLNYFLGMEIIQDEHDLGLLRSPPYHQTLLAYQKQLL